jgi:hypothetical protein
MIPNFHCLILRCVLYRLHNPPVVLFSFFLNSFYFTTTIAGSSDFESRRRRSLDPDKIILDQTIFCEKEGRKKVKVKGSWTTEGTVRFEYDSGVTVQRIAVLASDSGSL